MHFKHRKIARNLHADTTRKIDLGLRLGKSLLICSGIVTTFENLEDPNANFNDCETSLQNTGDWKCKKLAGKDKSYCIGKSWTRFEAVEL